MIEVYKISIQNITESDKQQIVNAIGRAGEEIVQRSSFQHIGFHSTPKQNSIGFLIADGENLTMIASADSATDRPDNLEDTTTIYRDKEKYVKIDDSGDLTIANNNNKIILKSNGDIELGEGTLKALVNEDFKTTFETHTHGSPQAPSGSLLTTPPAIDPAGATPILMTSNQFTQKTKAQ